MDFISLFLSLFGLGAEQAKRIAEKRAEAARLNAEVAGEVGRAMDLIAISSSRILRRCEAVCPNNPEIYESVLKAFELLKAQGNQLTEQTEYIKGQIEEAGGGLDWDKLLRKLYEWKVTSSRMRPWIEDHVKQYDQLLDQAASQKA